MDHEKDLIESDNKISEGEIISRVFLSEFLIGFETKDNPYLLSIISYRLLPAEYHEFSQNFLNTVQKPSYCFNSDLKHY
jgi:hypothetical protein